MKTKAWSRSENDNYKYWNLEDELILEKMVKENKSYKEIGKVLNRSTVSCRSAARRLNIYSYHRKKTYSHDLNFWETPSPINSYWAGMMGADGSLKPLSKRNWNSLAFSIGLQDRDISHVILFTKYLKSDANIFQTVKTTKKGSISILNTFHINDSVRWRYDLLYKFGLMERKCYRMGPPNLSSNFLKFCYIAGYIDGDGTIVTAQKSDIKNERYISIRVTSSSFNILEFIRYTVSINFPESFTNKKSWVKKFKKSNCYYCGLAGIKASIFIDYMQKFPVPLLKRKWFRPEVQQIIDRDKQKYPHLFLRSPILDGLFSEDDYKKFKEEYNSLTSPNHSSPLNFVPIVQT